MSVRFGGEFSETYHSNMARRWGLSLCELKREGRWEDTRYTIRWFLFDGEGTLKLDDGTALLPNDRYPQEKETFRLYYTPLSDEQSGFTVWVEDSDGQAVELEFDFNADNDKEDGYGTE